MPHHVPRILIASAIAAAPAEAAARRPPEVPDTIKLPYMAGRVYRVKLVPGAPFVIELPAGEYATNIWRDGRYWMAETTKGSPRVIVSPIAAVDVVGRKGFIHIETAPSSLRITLKVEAVDEDEETPGALLLYAEGKTVESTVHAQVEERLGDEILLAKKAAAEAARKEFEAWRRKTLENLRDDYEWGGDFPLRRVVDNSVQTWITLRDRASDKAVIQFVDKSGKTEVVNYELEDGVYVVQNKVLRPKEKFRLILGKEQAWVALK